MLITAVETRKQAILAYLAETQDGRVLLQIKNLLMPYDNVFR